MSFFQRFKLTRNVRHKHFIIPIAILYLVIISVFTLNWWWSRWPAHSVTHSREGSLVQRSSFTLEKNLIVVSGTINDIKRERLRMMVDTGNPYSMITPEAADKLNLNSIWRWTIISGSRIPSWRIQIEKAEIDDISIRDAMFTRRDIGTRPLKDGEPIQVLLGYKGFFEDAIWQVDYPARELRRYATLPVSLSAPVNRAERLAVKMENISDEGLVPIVNEVYVDGNPVRALLDTGSSFYLGLRPQVIDKYQLNIEWDDYRPCPSKNIHGVVTKRRRGKLKSLSIGDRNLGPTEFCLEPGEDKWDIKIGGAILQSYVITFDYINKQVFFELPTAAGNYNKDALQ